MSRILSLIVLVPLAALLVVFSVLNRAPVILSMDLFGTTPNWTLTAPLFVVVLAALILGVVLGGIGTFVTQARHRSKAARREREIETLRREAAASEERLRALREEREREKAAAAAQPGPATVTPAPALPGSRAQGALPAPRAA